MSVMGAGLIRPSGAVPTPPIDPNFVPYLNGVPITGVTGIGPAQHRSGSRFAVRSPDLVVTGPTSLICTMDWPDAAYAGDEANAVLVAELGIYAVLNDTYLATFRSSRRLAITDVPGEQSGGGSVTGRVKVDAGEWYIAGSFHGDGGAAIDDYLVAAVDPILLEVRPVERSDMAPAFYTRRTGQKLSVFDGTENALRATTVWGEDDAVTSVRAKGTTVYIHTHADRAEVVVHTSNEVESAGSRKTASSEQVYEPHTGTNLKYGAIAGTIKYGTPGVTY